MIGKDRFIRVNIIFLEHKNAFEDSQTIKDIERVEEQIVVEVLVEMEEEHHVPLSQQEHARPLYVEHP